ncbi:diaminobutyrate acetyltransferase [Rhodococcus sp. NPDC003318]|uniref:diaminobutyrate acetyltransferase n=1 Tax=Rhodococcus sp. NPDC003318 TaxID=3364503 RepID=UPI0036BF5694
MRPLTERNTPTRASRRESDAAETVFRRPEVSDGVEMWRIARDSRVLDLNSGYTYALWCRDFAETSIVAAGPDNALVGFVTGYRRPDDPDTLFVWQVAVDADRRGRGIATGMLDGLINRVHPVGVRRLETTVSPDNDASIAMFTALAARRGKRLTRTPLFAPNDFPESHLAEDLYTIGW